MVVSVLGFSRDRGPTDRRVHLLIEWTEEFKELNLVVVGLGKSWQAGDLGGSWLTSEAGRILSFLLREGFLCSVKAFN